MTTNNIRTNDNLETTLIISAINRLEASDQSYIDGTNVTPKNIYFPFDCDSFEDAQRLFANL